MLELKNISKKYNINKPNENTVLSDLSLAVNDGDCIAIMGRSGAGKSTLLHIIALLDNPTKGKYFFNGENVADLSDSRSAKYRNENIGILMQDFKLIETENVIKNVAAPLYFSKTPYKQIKEKAFSALKRIGIERLAKQPVSTLSGGEKQRVALAGAIVNFPSVLLADEPTGSLDSKNRDMLMDLILELNKAETTVIIVTHDNEVANRCGTTLCISDGKII